MKNSEQWIWIMLLVLPVLAGCGGPKIAPVTGTVTMDGAPIADVEVFFEPKQQEGGTANVGPYSLGTTDDAGKFSLKSRYGDEGAMIGEHHVSFMMSGDDPEEMLDELRMQLAEAGAGENAAAKKDSIRQKIEQLKNRKKMPEKYQGSSSEITAVVKAGENDFNFDLESNSREPK